MTNYYCDICGEKVDKLTKYSLPIIDTEDLTDKKGTILKRFYYTAPNEKEICKHCANVIRCFIDTYKVAISDEDVDEITIRNIKNKN